MSAFDLKQTLGTESIFVLGRAAVTAEGDRPCHVPRIAPAAFLSVGCAPAVCRLLPRVLVNAHDDGWSSPAGARDVGLHAIRDPSGGARPNHVVRCSLHRISCPSGYAYATFQRRSALAARTKSFLSAMRGVSAFDPLRTGPSRCSCGGEARPLCVDAQIGETPKYFSNPNTNTRSASAAMVLATLKLVLATTTFSSLFSSVISSSRLTRRRALDSRAARTLSATK